MFTILALIYINMQMQIIDLAYRVKTKEKLIKKISEYNNNINSTILTLKSANSLGGKVFSEHSQMEFMGSQDIFQSRASSSNIKSIAMGPAQVHHKKKASLLSFLPIGSQPAEAKTGE